MAAGSTLKKITSAAKRIYARGGTWKGAIKKAGAEYRAGKLGKVVRMKTKRKKSRRRKVGRATGVLYNSSGRAATARAAAISGRPYNGMIGGAGHGSDSGAMGSIPRTINHAKKMIAYKIGMEEMKKVTAKTKTAKRKISKKIAKHK